MNLSDVPAPQTSHRQTLETALTALDEGARALSLALMTLARTRKSIEEILRPTGAAVSRTDELRWIHD
jgi:hypothetical protein